MSKTKNHDGLRPCTKCGLSLPLDQFYVKAAGDMYGECKSCSNAMRATNARILHYRSREECLKHYGPNCQCCGESNPVFLTMDHIEGNGAEHKKQIKRTSLSMWLRRNNFPEGYQVLCFNCNSAKHINGLCPHQGAI